MKIINIVGKSGSGKTYMVDLVKKAYRGFVKEVESFTTREPRFEGEKGHIFIKDYYYINALGEYSFSFLNSTKDLRENVKESEMVAYQKLYDEHYFVTEDNFETLNTNLYIVDENGAKQVVEHFKNDPLIEVINVLVETKDIVLRTRLLDREVGTVGDYKAGEALSKAMDRYNRDIDLTFDYDFYDHIVFNNHLDDSSLMDFWGEVLGYETK